MAFGQTELADRFHFEARLSWFGWVSADLDLDGAIIQAANQKANGSWSGASLIALMALTLSSDAAPQEFAKGHPRFFVREIHKGSSWKYQKLKSLQRPLRRNQNLHQQPHHQVQFPNFGELKFW
jgi:hypothetical protein